MTQQGDGVAAGDLSGHCEAWTKACWGPKYQEDPIWALMMGGLPGAKCLHYCLGTIPGQLGGQGSWFRTPPKEARGAVTASG